MQMGLVILSGHARMLGESRHLTHHKSSPILPGEPRRASPLPLRRNRTALVVFCGRIELPNSLNLTEQNTLPVSLALRAGNDQWRPNTLIQFLDFNPRPPRVGSDTCLKTIVYQVRSFNPRSPRGERHW